MMCFHESPLVLRYPLVMRMLYFSQFFTPLCWICLWAKVRDLVFIICSLLVGIYYVTDKLKVEWKLHFLEWKTNSFLLNFPELWNSEIRILGLWSFKIFWRSMPPDPLPLEKGDQQPLVDTVGYSIHTCFNFYWNPWGSHCSKTLIFEDSQIQHQNLEKSGSRGKPLQT